MVAAQVDAVGISGDGLLPALQHTLEPEAGHLHSACPFKLARLSARYHDMHECSKQLGTSAYVADAGRTFRRSLDAVHKLMAYKHTPTSQHPHPEPLCKRNKKQMNRTSRNMPGVSSSHIGSGEASSRLGGPSRHSGCGRPARGVGMVRHVQRGLLQLARRGQHVRKLCKSVHMAGQGISKAGTE